MANLRCIEPGCEKHRVRNQRCVRHHKEHEKRQAELAAAGKEFVDHSAPVTRADMDRAADRASDELLDHVLANGGHPADPSAPRSLMQKLAVEPAVSSSCLVLDFTGQKDLLAAARAASEDLERDLIALLQALMDGKLCTTDSTLLEV